MDLDISNSFLYPTVLLFIPGLINLGIFIYSYFFFQRSKLSVVFSLLVFSAFLWQFSDGFLKLSTNAELARRLYALSDSSALIVISSGLYFSILFNKDFKKLPSILVQFIYLPTIIFIIVHFMGLFPINMEYSEKLGYVANIESHLFLTIEYFYIAIYGVLTAYFFLRHWYTSKNNDEKIKSGLIFYGFLIPLVQGILTEIIFPLVFNIEPIPLTPTFITFFSVAAIIGLKKYNLLSYSPYNSYEYIINNMLDAIIITDNNNDIKYVNLAAKKLFGYHQNELIDQSIFTLLADEKSLETILKMKKRRKEGFNDRYEVNMKSKKENTLNMLVIASPYKNKNSNIIGSILILHDLTKEKLKNVELTEALFKGEEKERLRLSQELHDGITQNMSVIKMLLQSLKSTASSEEQNQKIDKTISITNDSICEIRTISHNLHPLDEKMSLCEAVKTLIDRFNSSGLEINIQIDGEKPSNIKQITITNIYRVLQEFFNNTLKYAQATIVDIQIVYLETNIKIKISDNGVGFNINSLESKGIGLKNMKNRINAINGSFELNSELNKGTNLVVKVPY